VTERTRWAILSAVLAVLLLALVWLVVADAPIVRLIVRLYRDKAYLKDTVRSWGLMAPLVFIGIQALQVIMSPIPGEITGPVGGALFGTTWGLVYSSIGLTIGTLVCFGIGRVWGEPLVRSWLSDRHWNRMSFIIEAEGAILCFILYLIPGLPKDIISYLFGISPMPFWVFACVSTLGRLPGTWISSYFGAHVADHEYLQAILLIALVMAAALPIYYYRHAIIRRFHGGAGHGRPCQRAVRAKRLDERGQAS
jgi:uncharacterized membrane protein YdjX (TVP38/TMEM64 family)